VQAQDAGQRSGEFLPGRPAFLFPNQPVILFKSIFIALKNSQ
jgi:hypothetical protein